ncbi:hypothetical protein CBR_g19843 [Chara braunii]|uniref:F-box domain-containing protein n=1 Tax=Chara braunii TaxID=69332 RepID=A0A388JU53_CHABU|nr:hypothetical protein CBR_g19843 [Chara braunii]|eukprot:GBG61310.1 hypothetical protein CBR_g19843 [Chara braunii]
MGDQAKKGCRKSSAERVQFYLNGTGRRNGTERIGKEPTPKRKLKRNETKPSGTERNATKGEVEMEMEMEVEMRRFSDLPDDLISRILGFVEDVRDLYCCGATCKRWHVLTSAVLETDMPCGELWCPLRLSVHTFSRSVSPLLRRAVTWPRLRHVDLSGCAWLGDDEVRPLVRCSLSELRLSGLQRISVGVLQLIASGCRRMNSITSSVGGSNRAQEQAPVPGGGGGELVLAPQPLGGMPAALPLGRGPGIAGREEEMMAATTAMMRNAARTHTLATVPFVPRRDQERARDALGPEHPASLAFADAGGAGAAVVGREDTDIDRDRVSQEMRVLADRVRETQVEVRALVDGVRVLLGEGGGRVGREAQRGELRTRAARRPPASPVRTPESERIERGTRVANEAGGEGSRDLRGGEGQGEVGGGRGGGGGGGRRGEEGGDREADSRGGALQSLDLSRTTVRNRAVVLMATLGGWANLRELRLDGCILVSDVGITAMAGACPKLRVLSLSSVGGLTNQGLASIGLWLRDLEVLNLSSCRNVSDLREVVRNCSRLMDLDLGDTGVRTSDVADIAWIAKSLTRLSLRDCFIFDVGVSAVFRSVASFQRLRELDLSGIKHLTECLCARLCPKQLRFCFLCYPTKFSQAWSKEKAGGWYADWQSLRRQNKKEGALHGQQGLSSEGLRISHSLDDCPQTAMGSAASYGTCGGGDTHAEQRGLGSLTGVAWHSPSAVAHNQTGAWRNTGDSCSHVVDNSVSSPVLADLSTNEPGDDQVHRGSGNSAVVEGSRHQQRDAENSALAERSLAHRVTANSALVEGEEARGLSVSEEAVGCSSNGGCATSSQSDASLAAGSGGSLTCLDLSGSKVLSCKTVQFLAGHYPGLVHLSLAGCQGMSAEVLRECGCLWQNLKTLSLAGVIELSVDREAVHEAVMSMACCSGTSLESLSLDGCVVHDEMASVISRMCTRLRSLSVVGCMGFGDEGLAAVAKHCKELKSLALGVPSMWQNKSLAYFSGLEALTITNRSTLLNGELEAILANCPGMTFLSLRGCSSITEDGIAAIADCCPLLETVFLDSCDKITGRNICRLPMLRKLSLLECSSVTAGMLQVFAAGCIRLSSLVLPSHIGTSSLPVQPPGMGHICGIQAQSGFGMRDYAPRTWFSEARNGRPA